MKTTAEMREAMRNTARAYPGDLAEVGRLLDDYDVMVIVERQLRHALEELIDGNWLPPNSPMLNVARDCIANADKAKAGQ